MKIENIKKHIIDIIASLKEMAKRAKKEADNPKEDFKDYNEGVLMGYYSIITLLKHQAFAFCIDQKELGLADMSPDIDLLGLDRNPDVDFGEDNWAIDVMSEENVKTYLIESIKLLKEQATEAKRDADRPEEEHENYNQGHLMAYHSVFTLLKHQAFAFHIDQKELGLGDLG